MRKTDKKIEKQLVGCLTLVCDRALPAIEGFQWLTHIVNYTNFPNSLRVVCVFETDEQMQSYLLSDNKCLLQSWVQQAFKNTGITVQSIAKHVSYDSEERCDRNHDGNWSKRLAAIQ